MEHICPTCGIEYESEHALARHIRVQHAEDDPPLEEEIPEEIPENRVEEGPELNDGDDDGPHTEGRLGVVPTAGAAE